jgi:hypothetical protein
MQPSQVPLQTTEEVQKPENIFSVVRQEVWDFLNNYIVIVPGYSFHQYLTIKRAHLYLNSKFEEQNDSGLYKNREKLFFNVVVPACEVATKMLNVDSKDIRLLPLEPKSYFSTYLLEKELKQWLKKSKFSNILNQIAEEVPRYGSCVIEKVKGGAKVVDLRKLMLDPTVDSIKNSRFVTTISYMTPEELRATGWDNVEVAIQRYGTTYGQTAYEDRSGGVNLMRSTPYIKVYKRYGSVQKGWIDGSKSTEMVKSLFIVAGCEEQAKSVDGKSNSDNGVVLFKSRWYKEWPFKDYHYQKIVGRWLGLGIVESLFDTQVRMNELKNQKRISMELSAMHLFWTADKQIVRNVIDDLQSGDVMLSKSGINPLANEERNLPAFRDEEESYTQHAQRLSFAYDAVSGETPAASSTATANINAQQQASSVFGFKRKNFTNMLRDLFNDLVLPELMTDLTPEHIMRFTGNTQELNKLDDAASEIYVNDEIKRLVLSGKAPTVEVQQALRDKAKAAYKRMGEHRFLKIKSYFYSDSEFEFDFNTGNEQVNPQVIAQNTQAVLSAIGANPGLLSNPLSKLLLFNYAEALGISKGELEMADSEFTQQQQMQPQMQQQDQGGQNQGVQGIPSLMQGSNQLPAKTQTQ